VSDGLLVVASHGGAARMGIIEMIGIPPERLSVFRVLNNCGWAVLEHEEKHNTWQLLEYNQQAFTPLAEIHI
jgi:broad specificity phosphatase PhoE